MDESQPVGVERAWPLAAAEAAPVDWAGLSAPEAAEAVRNGILQAAKDCELWGGDWPTDRGCENLLQVRAAEQLYAKISKNQLGLVTLEQRLNSDMGSRQRGRPFSTISDQQRADIALWTKTGPIYAIIEIKRDESDITIQTDLFKICQFLKTYSVSNNGSLKYGILGAYISGKIDQNSLPLYEELSFRKRHIDSLSFDVAKIFNMKANTEIIDTPHEWNCEQYGHWYCTAASVILTPAQSAPG